MKFSALYLFFGVTSINHSCRIGYKIDKNYRQLGLGSLMVKHMLEILTHEREMHRIEAYIHPENISSINLVKSLGFISEGTAYSYVKLNGSWQDHLRFVYIS
ncbi:MAG: GNAT family N-acetyltransferase [Lachnospira eligens]